MAVAKPTVVSDGGATTMNDTLRAPEAFEQEVRRVASAMWYVSGGPEVVGGTLIDAVFRTEEVTHLVECTIERTADKVREDVNKLVQARRAEERTGRFVRCWVVVRDEPTPHQRTIARGDAVKLETLGQFRGRLIRADEYVSLRLKHAFGSAADPVTGSSELSSIKYYPTPIREVSTHKIVSVEKIVEELLGGGVVLLLGDFGTGKSITVREVFRQLKARGSTSMPFPIAVNLREHWAQYLPSEVLSRHANVIGFPQPDQVVRAWRGGRAVLLLDGFDELAMQPWSHQAYALKRVRHDSVTAVRTFVAERPPGCGMLVVGREQYFNSELELRSALGLLGDTRILRLCELSAEDAMAFVKTQGQDVQLPDWFPKRPLSLSYFARTRLAEQIGFVDGTRGSATAWRELARHIAEREAKLGHALDADAVLAVQQRAASVARRTSQGNGPLTETDLRLAFKSVSGAEPVYDALTILLRLPGLAASNREDGGRYFVEREYLDVLAAEDVCQFGMDPHNYDLGFSEWQHPLGELGVEAAAIRAKELRQSGKGLIAAASTASRRTGGGILGLDLLCAAQCLEGEGSALDCGGLYIQEGECALLNLEDYPLSNLHVDSSIIHTLRLPSHPPENVTLSGCIFGRIEGVARAEALPNWVVNADCGIFDNRGTTAAIMSLSLPKPVRVALTILKKIYLQRGSGRVESALFRGLPPDASQLVAPLLDVLQAEQLIWRRTAGRLTIWHPRRDQTPRALQLLEGTVAEDDPLFARIERLGKKSH